MNFDDRSIDQKYKDARIAQEHLEESYPQHIADGFHWLYDAKPNQVEYYQAILKGRFDVICIPGSFEVRNGEIINRPDLTKILARGK